MNDADPVKIMELVKSMRADVIKGRSLGYIAINHSELKESSPHIYAMVLENSPGYFPILQRMVNAAIQVKNGEVSREDMDKKVGMELAKEYVYPNIDMSKESRSD